MKLAISKNAEECARPAGNAMDEGRKGAGRREAYVVIMALQRGGRVPRCLSRHLIVVVGVALSSEVLLPTIR